MSAAIVTIEGVVKEYQALRPLRIKSFAVTAGEIVSIKGLDAHAAEIFVNMVTGASLPTSGEVSLFGRNTRAIPDGQAWLSSLEGLAMISTRGVLIEAFTPMQNIAMPLTLDVDPLDPRFIPQAGELGREAGLDQTALEAPVGRLAADGKMRTHVARALASLDSARDALSEVEGALEPRLLIAEHPTATMPRDAVSRFGADLASVVKKRKAALLALTADDEFARALGGRRLTLNPATGELKQPGMMAWLGLR